MLCSPLTHGITVQIHCYHVLTVGPKKPLNFSVLEDIQEIAVFVGSILRIHIYIYLLFVGGAGEEINC